MRELLAVTAALSDESRVRALLALEGGELCVCQLIELLQLAPSTVSKHMSLLRAAGLVQARKDGRWMYYSLPTPASRLPDAAKKAIPWLIEAIESDPQARLDRKRIKQIKCEDKEELCRRQMCKTSSGSRCCSSAPAVAAGSSE